MSYKRNAAGNRDALFGGGGDSKPAASKKPSNSAQGYDSSRAKNISSKPSLSDAARAKKLKEAEENKQKAKKAMETGFFKKADPVAASTFYKRAADAYKTAGDEREERYMRMSTAECNMRISAWPSAANEYTRAAELALADVDGFKSDSDRRREASDLHKKAAEAWTQQNEKAKAAKSTVDAAVALNHGAETNILPKDALAGMEEAVEAHVPDPLNPYSRYRQTGCSAYIDPNSDETPETASAETKEFAKQHVVAKAYSHEPVMELIWLFVEYGEYGSALYAAGACTAILEHEGMSRLTLSRAYLTETILTLAMGDPILAEQQFLNRHVQKTHYLSSRECQLAEELFRAIKNRDIDALEEARSVSGGNRAALANLSHNCLRQLVKELRPQGVARKQVSTTNEMDGDDKKEKGPEPAPLSELLAKKTGYEQEAAEGENLDAGAVANELDELDIGGGLSDSDEDGLGGSADELDALEDDDIDLR